MPKRHKYIIQIYISVIRCCGAYSLIAMCAFCDLIDFNWILFNRPVQLQREYHQHYIRIQASCPYKKILYIYIYDEKHIKVGELNDAREMCAIYELAPFRSAFLHWMSDTVDDICIWDVWKMLGCGALFC